MPSLRKLHKLLDPDIRAKNLLEVERMAKGVWFDMVRPTMGEPIFLIGCSRSGTTVTYETIAASTRLKSFGYELPQFWNALSGPNNNDWHSEAASARDAQPQFADRALRFFYQRVGAGRVLDKTCINTMRVGFLHALFPHAKFVFIQRDGRDNVSSMIDGWRQDEQFKLRQFLGEFPCEVAINGGEFDEWSFFLPPGWRDYNHASVEEVCAYQWRMANELALEASRELPPEQWIHLRYEDLFERPVDMFREVFERLDLEFEKHIEERCRTLDKRPTSIVNGPPKKAKWKSQNPELIERILDSIAPMQRRLGYET